jgi:hypothetical protein
MKPAAEALPASANWMTVVHGLWHRVTLGYIRFRHLERCTMSEGQVPAETPEAWELDDLSRMRRVHEDLDREYLQIHEGPYRRQYEGSVPNLGERLPRDLDVDP